MLVKTVNTILTTNTAGQVVESLPVREAEEGETDILGNPIDPIEIEESDIGIPVRVVAGKITTNSVGQPVASIAVIGGVFVAPAGFLFLIDNDGAYLVDSDGAYLMERA